MAHRAPAGTGYGIGGTVHSYRKIFSVVPSGKTRTVFDMLKAIHAEESREEALYSYLFPPKHHRHIKINNPLERIMREIRRRARVVGNLPDGKSALMLVAARLRHISTRLCL